MALHEVLGRQIAEVPKDGRPIFAIEAIALGLTQSALHRNLQATKLLFELMADWSERDQLWVVAHLYTKLKGDGHP